MRIELDYNILILSLISLFIVIALSKTNIPRKPYKIILTLVVAITMPSFIIGHGEIVMIIPNGALFVVASTEVKVIGVLFTILNYFIAWFILPNFSTDK